MTPFPSSCVSSLAALCLVPSSGHRLYDTLGLPNATASPVAQWSHCCLFYWPPHAPVLHPGGCSRSPGHTPVTLSTAPTLLALISPVRGVAQYLKATLSGPLFVFTTLDLSPNQTSPPVPRTVPLFCQNSTMLPRNKYSIPEETVLTQTAVART